MSKIILRVEVEVTSSSASPMYVDDKLESVVKDMETSIRNSNDWDYPFMVWQGYDDPHPAELSINIQRIEE